MPTPTIDQRAARVEWRVQKGNTHHLRFRFPSGFTEGRSYQATMGAGAVELTTVVETSDATYDDVLVSLAADLSDSLRSSISFKLSDTTDDDPQALFVGSIVPSEQGTQAQTTSTVVVTLSEATVVVDTVGAVVVTGVDEILDGLGVYKAGGTDVPIVDGGTGASDGAGARDNLGVYSTTQVDTALALKANLASPALSGTPTAPTAAQGTNTDQVATTAFVRSEFAASIGSAPGTLDQIQELADAIGDDPNFAVTVAASVAAVDGRVDDLEDAETGVDLLPAASSPAGADRIIVEQGTVGSGTTRRTTLTEVVAVLAVPKAGGTFTGEVNFDVTAGLIKVDDDTGVPRLGVWLDGDTEPRLAIATLLGAPAIAFGSGSAGADLLQTRDPGGLWINSSPIKASIVGSTTNKTGNYTFVLADAGNAIHLTGTTNRTFTIPPVSSVVWPAGSLILVAAMDTADLTIAGGISRTVTDMVTNGTTTITSATAAFSSSLDPDRAVDGTNIPAGTTIASVTNSTTAVMSQAATGSGSGGTLNLHVSVLNDATVVPNPLTVKYSGAFLRYLGSDRWRMGRA